MKANLLNATELAEYLSARTVRDENGCWLWTYSLTNGGYARIAAPWGGSIGVHRLAYIVFRGNMGTYYRNANTKIKSLVIPTGY